MKKILGILLFITMSFACTAKNPATKYQISKEMDFGEYGPWKVMSVKFTYNSNNQLIYEKGNDCEYWCEYEYNSNGKIMKEYLYELCN